MKKFAKIIAAALCAAMLTVGMAACNNNNSKSEEASKKADDTQSSAAAADDKSEAEEDDGGEDLGFTEVPIFEDEEKEFLNMSAVYFQPVDMTGGYKAEDYDCHLELDVKALKNELGYPTGSWVPYLTVNYEVTKNDTKKKVSEGTFMPMAASDGPHYGANIKMDGDGLYTVTFTVKFPDQSTYLIHTDETGPKDHAFPNAIVYTYDQWQFTSGAWAE